METILVYLTSWQFILLCVSISAIVYVIRTIFEVSFIKIIGNKWWRSIFLPLFPITLGALLGIFGKTFPYPDGMTGEIAHIVFGISAGSLAGTVYQVVKGMFTKEATTLLVTIKTTMNKFLTTTTNGTPINSTTSINTTAVADVPATPETVPDVISSVTNATAVTNEVIKS